MALHNDGADPCTGELVALQQRCAEAEQQAAAAEATTADTQRQLESSRQRVHALQRQVRAVIERPVPYLDHLL